MRPNRGIDTGPGRMCKWFNVRSLWGPMMELCKAKMGMYGRGRDFVGFWLRRESLCKSRTLDEIHYKGVNMTGTTWHNKKDIKVGWKVERRGGLT